MISVCSAEKCYGCSLCEYVCPKNAISINYETGFYRPVIDAEKCIDCNTCARLCPANSDVTAYKNKDVDRVCYAAWSNNLETHYNCASGGLATELARSFMKSGGFVVGAAYDEDSKSIKRICVESVEELDRISKSKYVQANRTGIYKEIYERILTKKCLFIGVPCEVFTFRKFCELKKIPVDKYFCIDILCHGGASPKFFVEHQEKKVGKNAKITNVEFRGGEFDCFFSVLNKTKVLYRKNFSFDEYFWAFLMHVIFQPICYSCSFAESNRVGDITLGDFWELDKNIEEKSPCKGVSLVIVNNSNGAQLFESVKDKITYFERDVSEAIAGNDTLKAPTEKPENFNSVWKQIEELGFDKAIAKAYGFRSKRIKFILGKSMHPLMWFLPKTFKQKIKMVLKRWIKK